MAESLQFSQSKKHDLNSDSDDDDYEEYCEHFTYSVSIIKDGMIFRGRDFSFYS